MIVHLHVREITLHGIPVQRADLPLLEQAICSQLGAHLRGLAHPDMAAAHPAARGRIDISQTINPVNVGRDIARSLYPVAALPSKVT